MAQATRALLETRTSADPATVLQQAKEFFAERNSIYAAYIEREGPNYVTFRGQGGEELIVYAVKVQDSPPAATAVTGSSYLFDAQIARFFATLPPAPPAPPAPSAPSAPRAAPASPAPAAPPPGPTETA